MSTHSSRILLLFAHKGEAQIFIKQAKAKQISSTPVEIYESDQFILALTKEGIYESLSATTYLLEYLPQIEIVYNIGIAGALPYSNLKVGDIVQIRTSYAYEDQPLFKSFSTFSNSVIDCISVSKRISDFETSKKIGLFASAVDRELWGIGFACQKKKILFYSYKLISDSFKKEDLSNDKCFELKQNAKKYSQKLYEYFIEKKEKKKEEKKITQDLISDNKIQRKNEEFLQKLIDEKTIHLSFYQKKQMEKLLSKLKIPLESLISYSDLVEMNAIKSNKKVSIFLMEIIQNHLYPLMNDYQKKVKRIFSPYKDKINLEYDKLFEKEKFSIKIDITSVKDWQEKLGLLKSFPIEDLYTLGDHSQSFKKNNDSTK